MLGGYAAASVAGLGRRLVDACLETARDLEIKSVFALTNAVGFFERCGYQRIDKSELPQRIWSECVRCPSFPNCLETALIRSTELAPALSARVPRFAAAENLETTATSEHGFYNYSATISYW